MEIPTYEEMKEIAERVWEKQPDARIFHMSGGFVAWRTEFGWAFIHSKHEDKVRDFLRSLGCL